MDVVSGDVSYLLLGLTARLPEAFLGFLSQLHPTKQFLRESRDLRDPLKASIRKSPKGLMGS